MPLSLCCSNRVSQSPSHLGGMTQHFYRALWKAALSFCLVAALGLMTLPMSGQQMTGSIVGTVTDSTGAIVNGASVSARDVERGTVLTTRTGDEGTFDLPSVPVGKYQVTVEAKGFQKASYPQFTLVLNQTARINLQMKVGAVSETVEVNGTAPILQT